MKRFPFFVGVCLLWLPAVQARQELSGCGTHGELARERLFLHQRAAARRRVARLAAGVQAAPRAAARDSGDLVILEDADGVVGRLNPFDLVGKSVTFVPGGAQAARYRFQTQDGGYDAQAAESGTPIPLGDDDFKPVALPFLFPFFGVVYQRLYVNSDGNLTFATGDNSTSERSLGRVTAGPPRIAALFRDLDPSQAPDGVRLLVEPARVVVSWVQVPEYRDAGRGPQQTFQARLYPDGRIEIAFDSISTQEAVVGISPGRLQGSSATVSFSDGSTAEYSSTVAERFSGVVELDLVLAAQKFYETHEDAYDYLVFFNNLDIDASSTAVAYELTLRTGRQGIGDTATDIGAEFGSGSRLQAVINMGQLSQYPADPYGIVTRRAFARDTTMSVLAHEAGHLFLAYASVRDPGTARPKPMLCSDLAHWSFTYNSDASLVSGNRIRDNGAGVSPRFTTVATVESYSALDRYLMGLIPSTDVPPSFLVRAANAPSCLPMPGVSFDGERRDVAIEEIMGAEGRRTPDYTVSQKRYRFAFVLVTGKGVEPPADQLARVDRYRTEFGTFFSRAAGDLAKAETTLARSLKLSMFPAAGVLEGGTATATVSRAAAATAPLAVTLRSAGGLAGVPATVTIPAGAAGATFTVRGLRAGVDELTAEASGDGFETGRAYLQVARGAGDLKLEVESGDRQAAQSGVPLPEPVVLRVVDVNRLPYQGLTVRTAVSAGGSVSPVSAQSDEAGLVRFVWTPGAGAQNELKATLEGGAAVTLVALGAPAVAAGGVVNAASGAAGLAPGGIASLFGASLSTSAAAAAQPPLPVQLAGVRVLIDGAAAPLYYVSDRQINFVVPATLPPGEVNVTVSTPLGNSAPVRVPAATYQPGIFFDPLTGLGAVIPRGEYLEVYGTGLGPVGPSSIVGLEETLAAPTAKVDGRAVSVVFSGLSPGWPGLYQVNLRLPADVGPGRHRLSLEIGGRTSNEVSFERP